MFLLKLNFEKERQLNGNFWFYILIIYMTFFDFQCLSGGIYMYFHILTGVENGRSKTGDILVENDDFES